MDDIIRVQIMSEKDGGEGDLEWADVMEECKRELSCVCQKMAQAIGWHLVDLVGCMPLNLASRGRRR